ncbi:MAG: SCO1664 family protein [Actinomycetia bacterium]|nr:SCO1664 family protein [Actinomycetes bacterium]MCP4960712.1 SCO1664 family protein [Actinomycetes bacterium]
MVANEASLRAGDIEVQGRMPWSSNQTFLVHVLHEEGHLAAVYKPAAGERRLWDFPSGLYRREIAAFELSRALNWHLVPPTVERDGPFGQGSLQLLIEADYEQHFFTLVENPAHHHQLRRMCTFDLIANNTDRKSGHCLIDRAGHIWGIDHGLCFAEEFKLRTVIWNFEHQPIDDDMIDDLGDLGTGLPDAIADLLDRDEQAALLRRLNMVLDEPTFPHDPTGRRWPWPLV